MSKMFHFSKINNSKNKISSSISIALLLLGMFVSFSLVVIPKVNADVTPNFDYAIFTNATSTYEITSAGDIVQSGTAVSVWNYGVSDTASSTGHLLYVYNGSYTIDGTINMASNVNITVQDGVYLTHSASDSSVFYFDGVTSASINANSDFTITGNGGATLEHEYAFQFHGNNRYITIQATQVNGTRISHTGSSWITTGNTAVQINDSAFINLYGYDWCLYTGYAWAGMLLDGLKNVQITNVSSNAMGQTNVNTRSPLVIGGQNVPSDNVTIQGGTYSNSYADNGIYLGGWEQPVTNIHIIDVTTLNNCIDNTGHSGLKLRPASNVTVTGWHSINDYNGMEMGSTYDTEGSSYNGGGSWYNNIQGTIDNPRNVGLVVGVDGSATGQDCRYNTFNITVTNSELGSVWWYNGNYNNLTLVSTGAHRNAITFSDITVTYNIIHALLTNNGQDGYADIGITNLTSINHNTFYANTTGNANGLLSGITNATNSNYVYSPYYDDSSPTIVTVTTTLTSQITQTSITTTTTFTTGITSLHTTTTTSVTSILSTSTTSTFTSISTTVTTSTSSNTSTSTSISTATTTSITPTTSISTSKSTSISTSKSTKISILTSVVLVTETT
jgi:hypothetical protein